ncbi:MAG: transposase, partial [Kiritimatiellia bacterium]
YQRALCYHVMNRGMNRQRIFSDDKDRAHFTRTVAKYKTLCGAKIYHWCWMANHYHILVEIVHDDLRNFAGGIQQVYAQYHHARHDGCGVFWQGRFKSRPVEIGSYLVSCGRYIERNPVRAGLIGNAWDYRWSSASCYVKGTVDGVTDENPYLGAFEEADRHAYSDALISGHEDEAIIRSVEGERAIGSTAFANGLKMDHGRQRVKCGRPYL